MKITESLKGILLLAYKTSMTGTRLHPMRLLAKTFPLKFPNLEDCLDNRILSVNGQQNPVAEGNTNLRTCRGQAIAYKEPAAPSSGICCMGRYSPAYQKVLSRLSEEIYKHQSSHNFDSLQSALSATYARAKLEGITTNI